jgi:hypothetical protein
MEPYIKDDVSDITYMSELTLDTYTMKIKSEPYVSRVNSRIDLCSLSCLPAGRRSISQALIKCSIN